MIVSGKLRGFPLAVRLTNRERRVFQRAVAAGFLSTGRVGRVDIAWEVACGEQRHPCITIRRGRSTSSVTVDLLPACIQLDDDSKRQVRMVFFRASRRAPNPAARGRLQRTILTPNFAYARVPVALAKATAGALLRVLRAQSGQCEVVAQRTDP